MGNTGNRSRNKKLPRSGKIRRRATSIFPRLATSRRTRWRTDVLHKSQRDHEYSWVSIEHRQKRKRSSIEPWNPWRRNRIANFRFLPRPARSRPILIAVENFTYASRSIIVTQMRSERNPGPLMSTVRILGTPRTDSSYCAGFMF